MRVIKFDADTFIIRMHAYKCLHLSGHRHPLQRHKQIVNRGQTTFFQNVVCPLFIPIYFSRNHYASGSKSSSMPSVLLTNNPSIIANRR